MCAPSPPPIFWFRLWPHPNPLAWGVAIVLIAVAAGFAYLRVKRFEGRFHPFSMMPLFRRTRVTIAIHSALWIVALGIVGPIVFPFEIKSKRWVDQNVNRLFNDHCTLATASQIEAHLNQTVLMWAIPGISLVLIVIPLSIMSDIGRSRLKEYARYMGYMR